MNGKTCIVTGGTSGIGEASALALAEKGADLAIVCRSEARGEATRARIEEATGRSCVQLFYADLQRLEDVRRVAAEMDLAVGARLFVGVACSTVSQLIVKRREALGRPFMLWP